MASNQQNPDPGVPTTKWHEMARLVNTKFDGVIVKVNERKIEVLSLIKDLQEKEANLSKSIKQVEDMKYLLQEQMRENLVVDLQEKTVTEFTEKLSALRLEASTYTDYMFVCNEKELDRALSTLGSIELKPKQYLDKGVPKLAFGHLPDNPMKRPARFSCDESLDLIAISDVDSKQIFLFSMKGDFIDSFGKDYFKYPYAVKIISNRELLVSDFEHETICKVKYDRDKKTEPKIVPLLTQSRRISSLDYDKESDLIYATSSADHCIIVLKRDGQFISKIQEGKLLFPQCLYLRKNEIYVLDENNPALHIISKSSHELIRSIIPRGIGIDLEEAAAFTLDQHGNIIIGNHGSLNKMIQIYSPSGQLVHSFSNKGTGLGELTFPGGIYVTQNNDVIVFSNTNYPIQIF